VLHPQLLGEEKSPARLSKAKVCREEFTEQLISPWCLLRVWPHKSRRPWLVLSCSTSI